MENKIQKRPITNFEFPAKIFLLPVSGLEAAYYIYSPRITKVVLSRSLSAIGIM